MNKKLFHIVKKVIILSLTFTLMFNVKSYALSDKVTLDEAVDYYKYLLNIIQNNYMGEGYENITLKDLVEASYKGMFDILDDYSEYYTEKEYKEVIDDNDGIKYGLGAMVQKIDSGVKITQVLEDSGAERAGLLVDDIITKVEDIDIRDLSLNEILPIIQGEKDTKVNLTINRKGNILNVTVIRCEVKDDPVSYFLLSEYTNDEKDNNTLVIELENFNKNAYEYFKDAFDNYDKDLNLILDLRNNGGGYSDQAIKICSYLLGMDEDIFTLKDKKGNEVTYTSKSDSHVKNVVVIINENSASASEVTTGALKDNKKAIVVGQNSFGKNVSQTIYPLGDINFKLTEQTYVTPNGTSVLGVGITPDIYINAPKFIYDVKYKYYGNEKSDDIIAAKSMLKYLGYNVTNDTNEFDTSTVELVKKFQADTGLGPYGALDYTTQRKLNELAVNKYNEKDEEFEKAIDVIRNFDKYKKELGK